ncbi:MAG: hypothetical protein ABFD16_16505 [Thermoguttaceae bacterium]|jgi:hypothetical protein
MSGNPKDRKVRGTTKVAPIKPGSPLYRVLEMIAREVAKGLDGGRASPENRRCKSR